jgi:hypothetical protein
MQVAVITVARTRKTPKFSPKKPLAKSFKSTYNIGMKDMNDIMGGGKQASKQANKQASKQASINWLS